MRNICLQLAVIGLIVLFTGCVGTTNFSVYESTKFGYKISYPDFWQQKPLYDNTVMFADLNQFANIVVEVRNTSSSIDDIFTQEVLGIQTTGYTGYTLVSKLNSTLGGLNSIDAVIKYNALVNSDPLPMAQKIAIVKKGGLAYIIVCTSTQDKYSSYEADFTASIKSFAFLNVDSSVYGGISDKVQQLKAVWQQTTNNGYKYESEMHMGDMIWTEEVIVLKDRKKVLDTASGKISNYNFTSGKVLEFYSLTSATSITSIDMAQVWDFSNPNIVYTIAGSNVGCGEKDSRAGNNCIALSATTQSGTQTFNWQVWYDKATGVPWKVKMDTGSGGYELFNYNFEFGNVTESDFY